MMMNVRNCEVDKVHIGMAVNIVFEARGENGQLIPQAEPAS